MQSKPCEVCLGRIQNLEPSRRPVARKPTLVERVSKFYAGRYEELPVDIAVLILIGCSLSALWP